MIFLKIPLLVILVLIPYAKSIPVDTAAFSETDAKVQETINENQNEPETKYNENTVNLNLNRVNRLNKPNLNDELQSLIEEQRSLKDILSKSNRERNRDDRFNVFNPDDLKKYRENRGNSNKHQQAQPLSSQKELESARLLQSTNDKKPLEKIFGMISRSNFRVRGLIIINNNNNNNNIDEDKFTIDEIIKLLEKRDYIGYQDILEYDKVRRLSAIKSKKSEENLKPLKAEIPNGEATELVNIEQNKNESNTTIEDPNTIKNNNHVNDPIVSINMLKAKNEKSKPLQVEMRPTSKGGIIIINNKNNNNNEKIKSAVPYKEPVNITNSNDGVQLPMDKLSKQDIENLLENSIIVNNDNNNNNIT